MRERETATDLRDMDVGLSPVTRSRECGGAALACVLCAGREQPLQRQRQGAVVGKDGVLRVGHGVDGDLDVHAVGQRTRRVH